MKRPPLAGPPNPEFPMKALVLVPLLLALVPGALSGQELEERPRDRVVYLTSGPALRVPARRPRNHHRGLRR